MSKEQYHPPNKKRHRPIKKLVIWGVISLTMYLLVFLNQDTVTEYFTKGGAYAIVVVITALAFALIHGSFANYLLEVIGLQPSKGSDH